jgi:hypothetical protein
MPGTRLERVSATVPASSSTTISSSWSRLGVFGNGPFEQSYWILQQSTAIVSYTVWTKIVVPEFETLLQRVISQSHLRLGEVPGVIWELTYLSWMWDYFLNIGDLLACNFDYNAYVSFGQKGVTSHCVDALINYRLRPRAGYNIISHAYSDPYMLSSYRTYNRYALDALPGITPWDFHFELPGTTDQFLNMAAFGRLKFDKLSTEWAGLRKKFGI